ncbi:hypothetical protein AB0G67_48220 [Streptomyces sp. NPDC021056]|uniref:hypothetical protein n=1 Tax=Streptomyces sp. NPDC021056 TaxID=3155012 RepID=UPI0033D576FC
MTATPEAQTPLTHFEEFSLSGLRALSGLVFIGVLGPQGVELDIRLKFLTPHHRHARTLRSTVSIGHAAALKG